VLQVAANWNGWLVVDLPGYPSEKILVSWDDDIRKKWKNNPNVPNHQPHGDKKNQQD